MSLSVTLFPRHLWSKFGFGDGDAFDFLDEDLGVDFKGFTAHEVLVATIRRYVLPVVTPSIEVEVFQTCHNPVRVVGWPDAPEPDNLQPAEVRVTVEQIQAAVDELAAAR
jgi:hypothetical protein